MDRLLAWYDANKRDLPWRGSRDPYAVWVSEIMLQQTQVQTVIPYYLRWMDRFPTVGNLASADEPEVLGLWQGLGYYRRCRMLLEGARYVTAHGMPANAGAWLKVPGVGRYTAGAIASIALGEAASLVDGNVERVFARLAGCDLGGAKLTSAAWSWAGEVLNRERPGDHNQALMELGATICRRVNPLCSNCPLASECVAFRDSSQERLPTRPIRRQVVILNQVVSVPFDNGRFGLRQIAEGEWWQGMWEFPRGDASHDRPEGERLGLIKHVVTHHRISLEVFLVGRYDGLRWFTDAELAALPLPAPQRRALEMARAYLAQAGFRISREKVWGRRVRTSDGM